MCVLPDTRADVAKWWTELWSLSGGGRRTYCGVATTDEGFAVDVFRDDECIASEVYPTRGEAERAALALRTQHSSPRGGRPRESRAYAGRGRQAAAAHRSST